MLIKRSMQNRGNIALVCGDVHWMVPTLSIFIFFSIRLVILKILLESNVHLTCLYENLRLIPLNSSGCRKFQSSASHHHEPQLREFLSQVLSKPRTWKLIFDLTEIGAIYTKIFTCLQVIVCPLENFKVGDSCVIEFRRQLNLNVISDDAVLCHPIGNVSNSSAKKKSWERKRPK